MGLLDDWWGAPAGPAPMAYPHQGQQPTRPKGFWERASETTLGGMAVDAWNAMQLPGDVYSGRTPVQALDPATGEMHTSPDVIKRSTDLAGLVTVGAGAAPAEAGAINMGARRPPKPPAGLLDEAAENPRAVIGGNHPPSMYDIPAGSDPRYLGAAPDRSDYSLLRYDPPRGVSARTADALQGLRENRNGIKDQMLADIKRGEGLDGSSWYNTEELRDWFVKELGEERGNAEWREYMDLIGATSTGSKVPANIGNASYYRNKGMDWARENADELQRATAKGNKEPLVPPKGSGYGHKMQRNHAANVGSLAAEKWGPEGDQTLNPKPRGFVQSLIGSGKNIAADLHFTRYMAMASGSPEWLDNSAEVSGDLVQRLTAKYGDAVKPYLGATKRGDDGKVYLQFNAKDAVTKGGIKIEDLADDPQVFVGVPKDNEYKAFEDYMHELGKELGMTGPQVQANLWMGAAKRTGLADESQGTFMDLFRRRADERAKKEKIKPAVDMDTGREMSPREQVIRRFIRDRGLLAVTGGGAAGAAIAGAGQQRGLLDDPGVI